MILDAEKRLLYVLNAVYIYAEYYSMLYYIIWTIILYVIHKNVFSEQNSGKIMFILCKTVVMNYIKIILNEYKFLNSLFIIFRTRVLSKWRYFSFWGTHEPLTRI
jgi:hypothetical protein